MATAGHRLESDGGGLMNLANAATAGHHGGSDIRAPLASNLNNPNISDDGQGLFQCGYCQKHYNRADHLIRHVRSR